MLESVLNELLSSPRHAPHITGWRRLPAQTAPLWLVARGARCSRDRRGAGARFEKPFTHQVRAIDAVLQGERIVKDSLNRNNESPGYRWLSCSG